MNKLSKDILSERRNVECLYLIEPFIAPILYDEGESLFEKPRTKERLQWAETRLFGLSVSKIIENNVVKYTYEDNKVIIFANPLHEGGIKFKAYPLPLEKSTAEIMMQFFLLPDRYKSKLNEQFERFIGEAKKTMRK